MKMTESQLIRLITESVKMTINSLDESILLENEGTNMKKARRYLESHGYSNPTDRQTVLDHIRTNIPNSRLMDCYYLLGVTRLFIDRELDDPENISKINKLLKYIASDAHSKEYDSNLNDLSVETLYNRFSGPIRQDLETSKALSDQKKLRKNPDYEIVRIPDFKTAARYGEYTSWCVTHDEDMYNSYTNNGTGLFYFCLKNGFADVPMERGFNCPLDDYGRSMIAVSVTMDGECNTVTCRWNHDHEGNDGILSVDDLEDLLGVNFYKTFLPYTREELHAKGIILFDEVQKLLDNGIPPEYIFNHGIDRYGECAPVKLHNKWNFIDRKCKLLSDRWFDEVIPSYHGYCRVKLHNKWNFIDTKGKLLFDQWFDAANSFYNGFATIKLHNKWNFIDTKGKLLFDQWFDAAGSFCDEFAVIKLNGEYNFIDTDGKLLSKQWFDEANSFYNGFATIKLNGEWYKIDTDGDIFEF